MWCFEYMKPAHMYEWHARMNNRTVNRHVKRKKRRRIQTHKNGVRLYKLIKKGVNEQNYAREATAALAQTNIANEKKKCAQIHKPKR